jgi:hypothetical protein
MLGLAPGVPRSPTWSRFWPPHQAVDNLQHLEGARLDALQRALWAKAMEGDLLSVACIVRIIQARCRL